MALHEGLPSLKVLLAALAAAYTLHALLLHLLASRRRARLARQHSALPCPDVDDPPSTLWHGLLYRLAGVHVPNYRRVVAAVAEHRYQDLRRAAFDGVAPAKTYATRTAHVRWVYTNDVENVKRILATEEGGWRTPPARVAGLGPLLGRRGIFTTDGAAWAHARALLRPQFSRAQVSASLAALERHVAGLLRRVPRDGRTVDLSPLFFRLTMDAATEFLWGRSCGSQDEDGDGDGFAAAFARAQDYSLWLFRLGRLGPWLPWSRRFREDRRLVHGFVDGYVLEALRARGEKQRQQDEKQRRHEESGSSSSSRYVVMDELLKETQDPEELRDALLAVLLAGRDTTASTLTNIWHVLSTRPDCWARLQAEVAALGAAPLTFSSLKELPFLQALMRETLRVWPPVPANSRTAARDTVLPRGGGPDGASPLLVPEGQIVTWHLHAYHRQESVWGPDADEFNVDRWLGGEGDAARPGWHYLPFNGGPRVCLGQQYALTQMAFVTVRLCQAFKGCEARGGGAWRESLGLVVTNDFGAKVGLTPR